MAESAAKLNGEQMDIDREWIALHIPINTRKLISLQIAIIKTTAEWMEMEAELDADEEREVDLVLQEIQKKRVKTDSPGGKSSPTD
jgi:hypothetical protein